MKFNGYIWMEEPGRLQSMGSRRVRPDWTTSLSLFTLMHSRRKWQPTPVFLPEESQGQGTLVCCRLWVTQSQTRLKWLSSIYIYIYVFIHMYLYQNLCKHSRTYHYIPTKSWYFLFKKFIFTIWKLCRDLK